MRKFLIGTLVAAGVGGGVVLSGAAMSFAATGDTPIPNVCGSAPVGQSIDPTTQSGTVQVCTPAPEAGSVTANGSAGSQSGYVIAQGNTGSPVAGYLGVSSTDSGIVGCSGSQYNTSSPGSGTPNNVIVPTPGLSPSGVSGYPAALQQAVTNLQGIQSNPCTPAP